MNDIMKIDDAMLRVCIDRVPQAVFAPDMVAYLVVFNYEQKEEDVAPIRLKNMEYFQCLGIMKEFKYAGANIAVMAFAIEFSLN